VPGFIAGDVARGVFEMGWGLRLLWRCLPGHPLCDVFNPRVGRTGYELKWLLSWDDIFGNHERLDTYANEMTRAIEEFERNPERHLVTQKVPQESEAEVTEFGLFDTKEEAEQMLSTTMQQMSHTPDTSTPDPFITTFTTLHSTLQSPSPIPSASTTALPLLSVISQNSFTHALSIQSTLLQKSLLTLLFSTLNLQSHLSSLHAYFLFGNGVFITKLNEALFEDFDDEDVRSGGQHGLGLGIGMVDRWPPGAAKVTAVLRNLLGEMGAEAGGISFAYRELTDQQFDKVKNPVGNFPVPTMSLFLSLVYSDLRFVIWAVLTFRIGSLGFPAVAV